MKVLDSHFSNDSTLREMKVLVDDAVTGEKIRKLIIKRADEHESSTLKKAYSRARNMDDLRRDGIRDGLQTCCIDLADVLYSLKQASLGRASVLQESNRHVLIKVRGCAKCAAGFAGRGCSYVAGYICGALLATGRPRSLEVHEESCGRMNDAECVFLASW